LAGEKKKLEEYISPPEKFNLVFKASFANMTYRSISHKNPIMPSVSISSMKKKSFAYRRKCQFKIKIVKGGVQYGLVLKMSVNLSNSFLTCNFKTSILKGAAHMIQC